MLNTENDYKIVIYKNRACCGTSILTRFCYYADLPCYYAMNKDPNYEKYNNHIVLYKKDKIEAITISAYKMMKYLVWGTFKPCK